MFKSTLKNGTQEQNRVQSGSSWPQALELAALAILQLGSGRIGQTQAPGTKQAHQTILPANTFGRAAATARLLASHPLLPIDRARKENSAKCPGSKSNLAVF